MRLAIFSRFLKTEHLPVAQELFDLLARKNIALFIFKDYYQTFNNQLLISQKIETFANHQELKQQNVDFVITLGGDGTILEAATLVRNLEIPIMGINLGRLGFLAMIEKHRLALAIDALEMNAFVLDSRSVLHLESADNLFEDNNFALNDFTIVKRDTSSMVIIHTYLNGEFLNSYWADGIIIATPTGSTGYSLSCGGPIIFPNSSNFVITPVAPHNLNVRPLIIADDGVLSFEIEGRGENFLCTLDSRYRTIKAHTQLAIKKADFKVRLVRFSDRNFLYMLRQKLHWGVDSRN